MYKTNINEEIIKLMRGFFAMPVISGLGRAGILQNMQSASQFTINDFNEVKNKKVLTDSFNYLARIGLLELVDCDKKIFKASELGKEVFLRHSSFYVPHSYHQYMSAYDALLKDPNINLKEEVDRLENVVGSGNTHLRYFFLAVSFLKRRVEFDVMADIGCGNGFFLTEVLKNIPEKKVAGIDLSQVAIDVTYKNLIKQFPGRTIEMICSDAADIQNWGKKLAGIVGSQRLAISMWFLIHEISKNDLKVVINFLNDVYKLFPKSPLVIGELVRQPAELLTKERGMSIMPEYLFFHDLSGQGILSWDEYKELLTKIPYELHTERVFDELKNDAGELIPSAFVWCLVPKEK